MHKAAKAYFQTQVSTVSQGRLLLMLYEGAIKFLNQAKVKIEEKDYAQKGILISKALDIINELDSSLNTEKGGDLSENLHKLYFYCSTRLLNANLKMDPALIDEVINILDGLRSAYEQIIDTPEAVAAMQQAPAQHTQSTRMNRPMPQKQLFAPTQQQIAPPPATSGSKTATARQAAQYAGNMQTPAQQMKQQQEAAPAQQAGEATETAPATPIPDKPGFNLAGKRFAGAAMYKKAATQNSP